ncbi:MAG: tetratricopeptide repeat protein [bacterium]|nr:tetratricopeptide repeat protein [Gammaproteobacteria bacterium]
MKKIIVVLNLIIAISLSSCTSSDREVALAVEAGAPLFAGMGNFHHPITTSHKGAQQFFDQGMTLTFAFNHAESIRSFKAAQRLDPDCAMCYWGESLATGPNININSDGQVIMSDAERIQAYKVLQEAVKRKTSVTEAERAYIEALQKRYNGDPGTDRAPLDLAYASAMGDLTRQYPDDLDAAALYAESMMNTMPWNYWKDDGNPRDETVKVIEQLESVLQRKSDHALALHLYIHAVEASSEPARAEAAADQLANLVPGAGHLVHMPAHIYWRVGRYNDASTANIEAARVDEEYIAQCNAQGFYPALYYPHNIHFLWAASTMEGRSELSINSALRVARNVNLDQIRQFPTVEFFHTIPLLSYVRFGKWEEIMNQEMPPEDLKYSRGMYHYARGVAFAANGNSDAAKTELDQLVSYRSDATMTFLDKRGYPASKLMDIADELLQGDIEFYEGDFAGAAEKYATAVELQDSLPYTEPPFWYYPTRQALGQALMQLGEPARAEAVYRQDLKDYPRNGWSMYGLVQALKQQGKDEEAMQVDARFTEVWQMSDIILTASRI